MPITRLDAAWKTEKIFFKMPQNPLFGAHDCHSSIVNDPKMYREASAMLFKKNIGCLGVLEGWST